MKCTQCKWHKNTFEVNAATFDGNPNADIVFIGEAYGKQEALNYYETKEYKCFVGMAGKKFDGLLKLAGLTRDKVATMNAQRCYQPGNPTPTKSEMDTCFLYTYRDIQSIKPKLVVAMGGSALYQTTGKTGIALYRGRLLWSDKIGCKVLPVYHPAACIYDPDKWDILTEDFKSIPQMLNEEPSGIKLYDYIYINTKEDFVDLCLPKLRRAKIIYLDIETTGLDPWQDTITLMQLGINQDNIFILDGSILHDIRDDLYKIFINTEIRGQDYSFDVKFLAVHLDIMPPNWGHDSCLAEFILSGMKANDLSSLVGKYAPESFGYDDYVYSLGGAHKVKDFNELCQYAANDVGVLFQIAPKQYRALCADNLDFMLDKITIPCNKVLTKMSLKGVLYDIDALWEADRKYEKLAEDSIKSIKRIKGIEKCQQHFGKLFNPRSNDHVKWLMLEYYGLPVLKTTATGNPSVSKNEMEIYAEKYNNPYAKTMNMYRAYQGVRANFLSGVLPLLVNNVAHTNYSLHTAATGRPTSSHPNLQNIPRDKDIKRIFVARPGYVFIYADLSQIEVRVAAMLSQDPTLMRACVSEDFHSTIAAEINGMTYAEFYSKIKEGDPVFKELRNKAKTTTFGIMYGMSSYGLSYRLGISEEEASEFIKNYFKKMPGVSDLMEGVKNHVIEHGWVGTYFGFRRYFLKHSSEDHGTIREAQNHPIQGSAWNIMQLILIELDRQLQNTKSALLMQTYDSAVIEAHESEADDIAKMMKEVMETVTLDYELLNTVPVKADMGIGYNLKDLEKYI